MEILQNILLLTLCVVGSIFDLRKRIMPDTINLLISMLCLINFKATNIIGIIIPIMLLLLTIKYDGIGGGDIKFILSISIVLGIYKTIFVLVLGLTTMITVYFVIKMVKGKCDNAFPLIPFFTLGIIIQIFVA
ncbi:prepilin peptidase [uncultured Tyzzerella sp.]|uniref:prepilin peptidase n=1 Tax=uncultured Tyzzerella sp. TaxID=2321398 RepID=UPI002941FFE7|nr:prepilin peptidase [uncultured Tyzzerella sp.]